MADGHIHKHLHSMFHLLRSEETLKMAVKLESARYGRTRYLVVVSCSCKPTPRKTTASQQQHSFSILTNTQNSNTNKIIPSCHSIRSGKIQEQDNDLLIPIRKSVPIENSNQTGSLNISNSNPSLSTLKCNVKDLINEKDWTDSFAVNQPLNINSMKLDRPQHSSSIDQSNQIYQLSHNDLEESCLLGIDCNEKTTVGLVLRILGDTTIRLDGDGGFCISGSGRTHIFKPVSVQAMWSALQTLHKVCAKARENKFFPGGPSHDWVSYYDERVDSDQSCLNEWNAMDSLETRRPPSPDAIRNKPTEREETEKIIKTALKGIIVQLDLDEVTSKYIRTRLEEHLDMNLTEYKSFIDEEMLKILKQMDAPTKIFDHVYLGSEWNASNLEELQKNGVRHILNVTREIDNFFPGMFDYFNVRVYDDDKTNLLKHWDNTYKYISQAKNAGSNVLVHCKMGISRSASVVIAYAMKAYGWTFSEALDHVRNNRNCVKPNKNFLNQLETYQGMLMAMKNREKLQRSKSDTNLRSVKDARLLPGSEPTPLIQAFNAAAKKHIENVFQRRLEETMNRPKSWSPDSVESAILLPRQHSQSLENLPPECHNSIKSRNNVRLPCKNGQSYSVSQNQVFHLEEQQFIPNVKFIVNEFETNEKRRAKTKIVNKNEDCDVHVKKSSESVRENSNTNRVLTKPPISLPSCDKSCSLVSLKRSESNRSKSEHEYQSEKYSPVMKSRSLDATNIVPAFAAAISATPLNAWKKKPPAGGNHNRYSIQEHTYSSPRIGCSSIDNDTCRNKKNAMFTVSLSSNSFPSNLSLSNMSTDLITDISKLGSKNVQNLQNTNFLRDYRSTDLLNSQLNKRNISNTSSESGFVNLTIAQFAEQFPKELMHRIKKRCKSDGMLYETDLMSAINKRFSSSFPSEYSVRASDSQSISICKSRIENQRINYPVKGKRLKNHSLCRTVETLKLNFESKDTEKLTTVGIAKAAKRGKSLPSSPIANISTIKTSPKACTASVTDKSYQEINVRGLVDRYEITKLKNETNNAFNTATSTATSRYTVHQLVHHNTTRTKPPLTSHASVVVATKPTKSIFLSNQLYQDSQSFSRLKQHFNASAYNTM